MFGGYQLTEKSKKITIFLGLAIVAIATPFLVQLGIITIFLNVPGGTDDGWLGFWGGYLGAIIGIVGVYLQIRIQIRVDKKKSQESKRPKIRVVVGSIALNEVLPRVIQEYPNETTEKRNQRYKAFTSMQRVDEDRIPGISLYNISKNNFYDVIVRITYSPFDSLRPGGKLVLRPADLFIIPQMTDDAKGATIFYITWLFSSYFDNTAKKEETVKKVQRIELWGITEVNEIVKLEFTGIQVYNFMPKLLPESEEIKKEYADFMSQDIFPLIKVDKSYGEAEEKQKQAEFTKKIKADMKKREKEKTTV